MAIQRTARRRVTASVAAGVPTGLRQLEVVLDDAGIDRGRFARTAAAAIEELRSAAGLVADAPGTQLSDVDGQALVAGGLEIDARTSRDPDALGETAARYAALLADTEDVAEVADRLGVTRARIRQRALERSLLAIREGDEWRFPRAQFADGAPIRGLPAVSLALPLDLHPVAAWRFLTEPNADLELDAGPASPIAWLRSGGSPDPIVAIAREL